MTSKRNKTRSTTVILVRKGDEVAMAGDGQVTMGDTVMKSSARKIRKLYNDKILAGFAGATADAFSLLTTFESKLEQYHATSNARPSSSAKSGEPIRSCATSRRCWLSPTPRAHSCCRGTAM